MMNKFERTINASDLQEWIMCTFPDWCEGDVRLIYDHIDDMPSAQPETNCSEFPNNSDTISRQAAIDALNEYFARIGKLKRRGLTKGEKAISLDTVGVIKTMPSVQSEINFDEWCTDCKEYDHDKHCCPRFNKVIRRMVEELKDGDLND